MKTIWDLTVQEIRRFANFNFISLMLLRGERETPPVINSLGE